MTEKDKVDELIEAGIDPSLMNILLRNGVGCYHCIFKKKCLTYTMTDEEYFSKLADYCMIKRCPIVFAAYPEDLSIWTDGVEIYEVQ